MKKHTFFFKAITTFTFLLLFVSISSSYPREDSISRFIQRIRAVFMDTRNTGRTQRWDTARSSQNNSRGFIKGNHSVSQSDSLRDPGDPPPPPPRP
jgi:hypothetical protein